MKVSPKLDSACRWIVRYKDNQQRGQNEKDARRSIKGKSGLESNQRREDDSDERHRLPRQKTPRNDKTVFTDIMKRLPQGLRLIYNQSIPK